MPRFIRPQVLFLLLVATLACTSAVTPPDPGPLILRGLEFTHPVTADDSVRVAAYGQVVAVVRKESIILIMTTDSLGLSRLPEVLRVHDSLGTTPSTRIEVDMGVGPAPTDSAAAIMTSVGTLYRRFDDLGIVSGFVAANRLADSDRFPAITYLYISISPFHQV